MRRISRRDDTPLTLSRLTSFISLIAIWLRHRFMALLGPRGHARHRDEVYVDGSFSNASAPGDICLGGIGVWVPRRRLAFSIQIAVKNSMEAETLALLCGAMVAKHLQLSRPVIFSDCKSAVTTASRHLSLSGRQPLSRLLRRMFSLSTEHGAYRHTYSVLAGLRGSLEWRPREENREADLASCIGSRHGNMGIELYGSKNFSHALNDILSRVPSRGRVSSKTQRHQRRGTKTTAMAVRAPTQYARFRKEARSIIEHVLADVA